MNGYSGIVATWFRLGLAKPDTFVPISFHRTDEMRGVGAGADRPRDIVGRHVDRESMVVDRNVMTQKYAHGHSLPS